MNECVIRPARPGDEPGAYHVCLKTGDHGQDGEPFYREDPDALGRAEALISIAHPDFRRGLQQAFAAARHFTLSSS